MALKTKKIKKDQLEDLGDQFEVLSDEDVTDSGITLAEDEVLVQEKPAPPKQSNNNNDDTELRTQLHKANTESASRRIRIKEMSTEMDQLRKENTKLKGDLETQQQEGRKAKAKELFDAHAKAKGYEFVSEVAGDDIREAIFAGLDWSKDVTKEQLEPLIDQTVSKKQYVLKEGKLPEPPEPPAPVQPKLGSTDGGKRSSGNKDVIPDDLLEEVASEFNLPFEQKKDKGA